MVSKRYLISLSLAAFLTPFLIGGLPAHGVKKRFAAQVEEVLASAEEPTPLPPIDNERIFAWRLYEEGRYLLSEEQVEEINFIHTLFEESDNRGVSNDTVIDSLKLRAEARKRLYAFLEGLSCNLVVDLRSGNAIFDTEKVIEMASTTGMVMLKIVDGDSVGYMETLPYESNPYNAARMPEPETPIGLIYQPGAISWVMLRFEDVPQDLTAMFLNLLKPDDQTINEDRRIFIRMKSGPRGFLNLTTTEGGQPTPAMVRLMHMGSRSIHRPAGAVEFSAMMDYVSGDPVPSRGRVKPGIEQPYPFWIPGSLGGHYWCVAEPATQTLSAGDWRLYLWRGPEYKPMIKKFVIEENKTTTLSVETERWIDMAERGWHSGDVHMHSRLMSDTDADRLHIFMEATDIRVGNIVSMGNYLRTFFEQRGYGPEFRDFRNNRVLVPGQEDPRFVDGHSLAINIDKQVRDIMEYGSNEWVARQTREAGGLYGHAHMTFNGFNVRRDVTMLMPLGLSSFGEVLQIGELETALWYDFLNLGYPLTAAAGSDVPFSHGMGEVRHYVYTGSPELNTDDWFAAMEQGKTFVSNGPMLTFTVNGQLPGARLNFEENEELTIHAVAETWPELENGLKALRIYSQGEVIKEVLADADDVDRLELTMTVPIEGGKWIAAMAENQNRTKAHTTPVYTTRQGMRFWDYDAVPALLQKCFATLDEMETEMIRMKALQESEDYPFWNLYNRTVFTQIPDRLKRIRDTRELYRQLEEEWKVEGEKRAELGLSD